MITSKFAWEIILVDNNCNDNTVEIATRFLDAHKRLAYTIVTEERPGLSFARKRGIKQAKYSFLLFCDDDNFLASNYLETAYDILSNDSTIGALGGKGVAIYEAGFIPPAWFKPFERFFATGPQGNGEGVTSKGCLYGAGLILNRFYLEAVEKLGFVNLLTDRSEKKLLSGGDTELTSAIRLYGGKIYYSPRLHFDHRISRERVDWDYLKEMVYYFGFCDFLMSPYNIVKQTDNFLVINLRNLFLWIRGWRVAFLAGFGSRHKVVLNYERTKGYLVSSLFHYKKYLACKAMVTQIVCHLQADNKDE